MKSCGITSALAFLLIAVPNMKAQEPKQAAPAKPSYAQNTPEAALRSFYAAMMLGDEPALRRLALPAEGFEWLHKGQPLSPEQVDEGRKEVDKMALTRLKVGDELRLPGGRALKLTTEHVGEDRAVLKPLVQPLPMFVRRVDDLWKVDPRPIISARKAADAARRRAEEAKKKAGP